MVPTSPLALGLYLYIIAGLTFMLELLLFENARNVRNMRRRAKEREKYDQDALRWLRRIESPEYDPMHYGDEF